MSILGIALPLLGIGGIGAAIAFIPGASAIAGRVVAGALSFLSKLPSWALAVAALALLSLWLWRGEVRERHKTEAALADSARWEGLFHAEQTAFRQTVANVRAASLAAQRANEQHVKDVEAQQDQKSQEVSSDYEKRLADLRRRYDAERVRDNSGGQTGRPDHSPSGPVQGPVVSNGSGGSDDPTAPRDEIDFNCQANALQLEELQNWVREQASIKRNDGTNAPTKPN